MSHNTTFHTENFKNIVCVNFELSYNFICSILKTNNIFFVTSQSAQRLRETQTDTNLLKKLTNKFMLISSIKRSCKFLSLSLFFKDAILPREILSFLSAWLHYLPFFLITLYADCQPIFCSKKQNFLSNLLGLFCLISARFNKIPTCFTKKNKVTV